MQCIGAFLWRRHPDLNRGIEVLQTFALPLGHGAILQKTLFEASFIWSGRRDSNSRRSPWQGDALPLSHSRIFDGASGWNRTADTGIFSPLRYRLSYKGILLPKLKAGDPDGVRTHDLLRDRLAF